MSAGATRMNAATLYSPVSVMAQALLDSGANLEDEGACVLALMGLGRWRGCEIDNLLDRARTRAIHIADGAIDIEDVVARLAVAADRMVEW